MPNTNGHQALEEPGKSLLMSLAALPIAAALPLTSRPRLKPRLRKALLILGLTLMLLFYVVWALGFTNIAPQLYESAVLRAFGILFIIGLITTIASTVMQVTNHRQTDQEVSLGPIMPQELMTSLTNPIKPTNPLVLGSQ